MLVIKQRIKLMISKSEMLFASVVIPLTFSVLLVLIHACVSFAFWEVSLPSALALRVSLIIGLGAWLLLLPIMLVEHFNNGGTLTHDK